MAGQGLQICPHTCGCDALAEVVESRQPKWLGRCPIYETTGTDMKHHLVRDLHHGCTSTCPAFYPNTVRGRELTSQEFEAWIPFIGHLPQFRQHVPTQYEYLIVPGGRDVAFLPNHPLPPPPRSSALVPARYEDFFASLKPSSAPKQGVTRTALGSLLQDTSITQRRTYDDFFGSFSGLRPTTGGSANEFQSRKPESSMAQDVVRNRTLSIFSSSTIQTSPTELQSNANYHVLNFKNTIPKNYTDFFATAPPDHPSIVLPVTSTIIRTRIQRSPSPPPLPPPPPPPSRDLPAFQRILASAASEAISAAVLAAYTALGPAAQELFWTHLSNTATAPDGSLRLVARHQVCRHCAEMYDTADADAGGEKCTWHYGSAVLDPRQAQWPAPPPLGADSQSLYFWNCCGARLSTSAPGCLATTHAPIVPPDAPPLRMTTVSNTEEPATKKRKRTRGPTLHCAHCAAAYRENDGGRCQWHDGALVSHPQERWSCCGQGGEAAGCVMSRHVPPWATEPQP
ncbi:hypothetical protein MVEN_01742100 [Mycena venus]|uniref:Uncharacterized protein n=1 Tax=Mycena venus TaxID=2733690 RepID=A0A8H6XMG4_9AGAR|nr:hypothetical protein MVEN_01742100 [Mycena venus]